MSLRPPLCAHLTALRPVRPSDAVAWAHRVVAACEEGEREGLGAVGLDGAMVDRPIYLRARDLLERDLASR